MTVAHSITTAEQLWAAGDIGRCELVRGELIVMSPTNPEHSRLMSRLSQRLLNHLDHHPEQGQLHSGDPGFIIARNPDTVRAPDLALVRGEHAQRRQKSGYFSGAPVLAIEILSPSDPAGEVLDKVQDFLEAGTLEVWVVDPDRKTIAIYAKDQPLRTLRERDELTCESLLPGFRLAVAEVFG